MSDKVIVTAAITGSIHTPTMSPYLPITPQQIVDEVIRAYEAGAAVAHIHARQPETGQPMPIVEWYGRVAAEIKQRCNIVLCFTTGGGVGQSVEERIRHVRRYRPELASCNFGSLNFALFQVLRKWKDFKFAWEEPYLGGTEDYIFPNTFRTLREFTSTFAETETKAELEIYDLGMVNNVAFMLEAGHLKRPPYLQIVLGILGGAAASLDNLMFIQRAAKEEIGDFEWSVCAAGRNQIPLCTAALVMGGNVRVGLEDNLYLEKGVLAKSNAEQVAKIIRIARELGREPAAPDEAREILGLKGLANVAY